MGSLQINAATDVRRPYRDQRSIEATMVRGTVKATEGQSDKMRFKEGMRRIGLLVSVLGLCVGCYFSYEPFRELQRKVSDNAKFHRLLSARDVQSAIAIVKSRHKYAYTAGSRRYDFSALYGPIYWSGDDPPTSDQIDAIHSNGYAISTAEVKAVSFESDGKTVSYLTRRDGSVLFDHGSPSASEYLFIGLPLIGFLVPWVVIKCVVWVYSGFVESK